MKRTLILGPPGAGKTYELLQIVKASLRRGVAPSKIALVSFTNAAADEARTKACEAFKLSPKELPHFRTIHSLAFRQMGLRRGDVVGDEHLKELSEITGELFAGDTTTEGPAAGMNGDPLMTIDHYARTTMRTLEQAHRDHGGDIEWYRLKRFSEAYRIYKEDRGLIDFTDMLSAYVHGPMGPIGVEVAIVDESQDLSKLQRAACAKAFSDCEELYEAGDDDQSIHRWAGADEEGFLTLPYDREVLPLARRLPRQVFDLSREVVERISRRYDKETVSSGREGSVDWLAQPDEADLSKGTWLLMARTRAQLPELAGVARSQGVVYSLKGKGSVDQEHVRAILTYERMRAGKPVEPEESRLAMKYSEGVLSNELWHDALTVIPAETREYYLACLRRGERLQDAPRVRVETFHGAKGAEAENVLMLTDMTSRTQRGFELDPDSEHRVFYVGITRASQALSIVAPRGPYAYRL
jgi:superfamily I DNA/RNA helicase